MSQAELDELVLLVIKRRRWLRVLVKAPLTTSELVNSLDVSRSTVHRRVNELIDAELVTQQSEGYTLTSTGHLAHHICGAFTRSVQTLSAAVPIASDLPLGGRGETAMLDGGNIILPALHATDRPIRHFLGLLHETQSLQGLTPVILEQYVKCFDRQLRSGHFDATIIVTPAVLRSLAVTYADSFLTHLSSPQFDVYETTREVPFGLTVCETNEAREAVLLIYTNTGLCGLLRNDTPAAVGWANQFIQQYQRNARRITSDIQSGLSETDPLLD